MSKPSLIYVMLIWSLFVTMYFGLQTILLQNMYQNPQSAAQVADGTSKHYRKLFSPGKKSKVKATLHCTWLVLCRKKMNVLSKSTLYVFPFYHSLPTWCSTARFSIQFRRMIFGMSFSQDNMKNLLNKIGPENLFCITLCLGEITILNCGSERSSSLWWRNDILSRTDFSYLFVFFLLCSFFYTLIKMIITNSNSQVQGFIWMNKNEKGTLNKTKFVKGCFSHVQKNTSLGKVAQ